MEVVLPALIQLADPTAKTLTRRCDTCDPEPGVVGVAGVKPRAATAVGGLGFTPVTPTQAQSAIGGDNLRSFYS
jgi:hypothetical protein